MGGSKGVRKSVNKRREEWREEGREEGRKGGAGQLPGPCSPVVTRPSMTVPDVRNLPFG